MKETASLAIIGCGLTGTAMLYQFIRMNQRQREKGRRPKQAIRILVFEKTQSPGPGLPYGRDQIFPFHIINMRTGDMSIDAHCPEDFTHWVSAEQRRKFDDYKSVFMAHVAPIPLMNAEKILALLESGVLTINRLQGPYRSMDSPDKPRFEFQYQDQDNRILSQPFRFVVDARGQFLSYDHNPLPRLFSVGIMNHGQIINAGMARECALSTHKIALGMIRDLYPY